MQKWLRRLYEPLPFLVQILGFQPISKAYDRQAVPLWDPGRTVLFRGSISCLR
jgi:hypothetical protein